MKKKTKKERELVSAEKINTTELGEVQDKSRV